MYVRACCAVLCGLHWFCVTSHLFRCKGVPPVLDNVFAGGVWMLEARTIQAAQFLSDAKVIPDKHHRWIVMYKDEDISIYKG